MATLNVGTLSGRCAELVAALGKRRIDICAVQETRWSGSKSRDIGHGYKVVYHSSRSKANGVGIVASERFRDAIMEVQRYTDRLMKVVLVINRQRLHFFSAYAPQMGCPLAEKEGF